MVPVANLSSLTSSGWKGIKKRGERGGERESMSGWEGGGGFVEGCGRVGGGLLDKAPRQTRLILQACFSL